MSPWVPPGPAWLGRARGALGTPCSPQEPIPAQVEPHLSCRTPPELQEPHLSHGTPPEPVSLCLGSPVTACHSPGTAAPPAPQGLFLQCFLVKPAGCSEILRLTGCCGPHGSAGQTSIFPLSPASSIPHTSVSRHRHAETSDRVVKVTGAVILKYLFHIHGVLSLAFIETQRGDQLSS